MRQSPDAGKPEFSHSKYQPSPCNQIAGFLFIALFLVCVPCVKAQTPPPVDMSNVDDVLGGQRTILQVDDIFILQAIDNGNTYFADESILPTDNSHLPIDSTSFQKVSCNDTPSLFPTQTGWMYNTPGQVIVSLIPCDGSQTGPPAWELKTTGNNYSPQLDTIFPSEGNPIAGTTQLAMGNFIGNGFDQAVMIYVDQNAAGQFDLLARIAAANDPNNSSSGIRFGPAAPLQPPAKLVPLGSQIAVGDFNGDGKKEIAVLLPDGKTIQYFSVDPTTLALTLLQTKGLQDPVSPAALAAGRFRTPANADLAVAGQVQSTSAQVGTTVVFLAMTPDEQGGFTIATPKPTFVSAEMGNPISNVLTQAAPVQDWNSNIDQLIYTSNKTFDAKDATGHLIIGSFDSDGTFMMQSDTDVTKNDRGCVHSFSAGNFDNRDSEGNHLPNLGIAVYWSSEPVCPLFDHTLELDIWQADPTAGTNWLGKAAVSSVDTPRQGNVDSVTMAVGDLRGRSLRLGTPEKYTIDSQVQPDIVLGLPPMHIDYASSAGTMINQPECQPQPKLCVMNLTVKPTGDSNNTPFNTSFAFDSQSSSSGLITNTTSWSLGVKQKLSDKISWGTGSSVKFSEAFQAAHDKMVSKTYSHYSIETEKLTVNTGFADNILYTSQRHNIYEYPVIGQFVCPSTDSNCPDSEKTQLYVTFSVPDQVQRYQVDSTGLEWYQPVHEPGNIFSYPPNQAQLEQEFPGAILLSTQPKIQATDNSSAAYSTSWDFGTSTARTTGTVNSFQEGLGFAYVGGFDGAVIKNKFKFSIDVNASQSFGSLNTSTQTLAASEGIAETKPSFPTDVVNCCQYYFSGYILGTKPSITPLQTIDLTDGGVSPLGVSSTGPLFAAFTATPFPENGSLPTKAWWTRAYELPDVGLNHPARWGWNAPTATFNLPSTPPDPASDAFYQMKGFFITPAGDPISGPTLAQATAGDKLQLSVRVYNFSPVATDDKTLAHPAQKVFVSIWGQQWDKGALVGDSFFIGSTHVARIPGFYDPNNPNNDPNSPNTPNWVLVPVTEFDTSNYGGQDLVFWTLVFMTDAQDNLVPEQPGHGLTANPAGELYKQITDVPIDLYSNNVGIYGTGSQFHVLNPIALGAEPEPTNGSVDVDNVSLPSRNLFLNQRVKISANIVTGDTAASPVNVLYYDGNPEKGGTLFGVQALSYIPADDSFMARSFYRPATCGEHTLYVVARTNEAGSSTGSTKARVTIDAVKAVQDLSEMLQGLPKGIRGESEAILKRAERSFERKDDAEGIRLLKEFIAHLKDEGAEIHATDQVNPLIGVAQQVVDCRPKVRGEHEDEARRRD
jgi:hypothetical protein